MHFSGDVRKNSCFKNSEDSDKNVFGEVLFEKFELSNLSPITILKTDSITKVSCERS